MDQQSRQQALRAYCSNVYCDESANFYVKITFAGDFHSLIYYGVSECVNPKSYRLIFNFRKSSHFRIDHFSHFNIQLVTSNLKCEKHPREQPTFFSCLHMKLLAYYSLRKKFWLIQSIVIKYSGHARWFGLGLGQHLWQLSRLAWKHKKQEKLDTNLVF